MKNRRIVLTSLMLIAVLVMGIGFASLVETLRIGGSATFRPTNVVETEVASAIKFVEDSATPDEDYCVSATISGDNDAAMIVVFNDAGVQDVFTAVATFKVVYQATETTHLPSVTLTPVAAINLLGESGAAEGFTIQVAHEHDTTPAVAGKFSPGETMTITVTVTYDATVDPSVAANYIANISVALNYYTEDLT